ncbi:hypothetical protein K470DRAFT_260568 [Piedraia hortae CBS 480.64]|uniref:AA1-like domain-containing protein n=1 Tax=Piedraia hortae CBS 480.64 TaxID=1314780 RepID=A0A6A7BT32_9PEZI|nr:hypothetical protein K470DRAFT_260568 [Piedraia hortae CBS 480.64]
MHISAFLIALPPLVSAVGTLHLSAVNLHLHDYAYTLNLTIRKNDNPPVDCNLVWNLRHGPSTCWYQCVGNKNYYATIAGKGWDPDNFTVAVWDDYASDQHDNGTVMIMKNDEYGCVNGDCQFCLSDVTCSITPGGRGFGGEYESFSGNMDQTRTCQDD